MQNHPNQYIDLYVYNLNLCSGWYGANLLKRSVKEEMENIRGQLNLFKDCKAPCIVFAEVTDSIQGDEKKPLSKRPQMQKEDWSSFCKITRLRSVFLAR